MSYCYHCGRSIPTDKSVTVIIVEFHTGKFGTAHLHCECTDHSPVRYKQTITWDGATISDLTAFKRLHGRVAAINGASWGSVPVLLT